MYLVRKRYLSCNIVLLFYEFGGARFFEWNSAKVHKNFMFSLAHRLDLREGNGMHIQYLGETLPFPWY